MEAIAAVPIDVNRVRPHFLFPANGRIVTNNAASTQPPRELLDLFQTLAPEYDNVHRGQSTASQRTTALFESAYDTIARFIRSFYTDPDPRVEGLRRIACPTLVLLGEHDVLFVEPSRLMAREIPRARWVMLPGIGHMTAIEDPERTIGALLEFLDDVEAGRA